MLKALFALISAALFAGAALHVMLAEHPARMTLDDRSALAQWQRSNSASTPLYALLALVSMILGAWAWWKTKDEAMLIGAVLLGGALLVTFLAMAPVGRRLATTASDPVAGNGRDLLSRWSRLHGLRALLGIGALAAYLIAFLWP